jgi:nicotinate-nucleotide--dimethylbenzimidazole phosphoribosyltransferase
MDLLELGAEVSWTDADAASAARTAAVPADGRLAELGEWLAGTQGRCPPHPPRRVRMVVLGQVAGRIRDLADAFDVGLVEPAVPDDVASAIESGAAAVDAEIEAGADLIAVAGPSDAIATTALVSLLTDTEPVALLPRGADVTDSAAWIAAAERLRSARRAATPYRDRAGELLAALGSPTLATGVGVVLRTVARRTPLLLDGPLALAAALLCQELQPRSARWWQVVDTATDPVSSRALDRLLRRPVLDLGTLAGTGSAAILAVSVLRAAAVVIGQESHD